MQLHWIVKSSKDDKHWRTEGRCRTRKLAEDMMSLSVRRARAPFYSLWRGRTWVYTIDWRTPTKQCFFDED